MGKERKLKLEDLYPVYQNTNRYLVNSFYGLSQIVLLVDCNAFLKRYYKQYRYFMLQFELLVK